MTSLTSFPTSPLFYGSLRRNEIEIKHALAYSTEREHYDAVGECLLWTLETGLGSEAWTPDVAEAWTWVYGVLAKVMADGGDAALMERRKSAVQTTWKQVEDALNVDATKLFYKRLFQEYPEVMPLFAHADMDMQAEKLFKTVGLAVKYIDDPDELMPVLEDLGRRHADAYSTKREHYDAVGASLLWTLEQGLGEAWTPDVKEAWTWAYGMIAKAMADAGDGAGSYAAK